ncbi:MAG: putative 3-deoxy-D-manno-octulosonate 8-phosphate phosphatase [Pseudomonadota bacterium]|jgi:lipopolysaccharide export system protein LptC
MAWGQAWRGLRRGWDRLAVYLPVVLMGLVALATYLLARNTPAFLPAAAPRAATHEPDYFLRDFTVRSFDATGRLRSEVSGTEGRHYPDTDTLEIDEPRMRAYNERGQVTTATARRALSNGDGSEVQLFGDAVVIRQPAAGANVPRQPRVEVRGEFLHFFVNTEQLKSNRPVVLERDGHRFAGDSLDYTHLDQQLQLSGRVRGTILPGEKR